MKKAVLLAVALFAAGAFAQSAKTFEASYTGTISNVPAGTGPLHVWLPLPVTRGNQVVSDVKIGGPYKWTRRRDAFGNEYAFTTIANAPAGDLSFTIRFNATRQEASLDDPAERTASKRELERALGADKLVTLSPRVRRLAAEVTKGKSGTVAKARAIYEYCVTTMKYDKTIPGWGKGDTERACDIKAGNCTDFHSLFISLARANGIPARFVIGFPLTAADGQVKGYHCWAEFYVKGKGWIPVDASDASKSPDPAVRQYLFGHLDPNRIQFTVGRDLVLTPKTSEPLNYFIYPRAEAKGSEVGAASVMLQFKDTGGSSSR